MVKPVAYIFTPHTQSTPDKDRDFKQDALRIALGRQGFDHVEFIGPRGLDQALRRHGDNQNILALFMPNATETEWSLDYALKEQEWRTVPQHQYHQIESNWISSGAKGESVPQGILNYIDQAARSFGLAIKARRENESENALLDTLYTQNPSQSFKECFKQRTGKTVAIIPNCQRETKLLKQACYELIQGRIRASELQSEIQTFLKNPSLAREQAIEILLKNYEGHRGNLALRQIIEEQIQHLVGSNSAGERQSTESVANTVVNSGSNDNKKPSKKELTKQLIDLLGKKDAQKLFTQWAKDYRTGEYASAPAKRSEINGVLRTLRTSDENLNTARKLIRTYCSTGEDKLLRHLSSLSSLFLWHQNNLGNENFKTLLTEEIPKLAELITQQRN